MKTESLFSSLQRSVLSRLANGNGSKNRIEKERDFKTSHQSTNDFYRLCRRGVRAVKAVANREGFRYNRDQK
ncbi:hypothetical protein HOLDEFILI_02947 [Holdemania filiformis DSM 12042]|uniref:Uncharacterized protein n=1 Tax=Holdemania filiformis DSM 12042 TaxID=545696 RepID=B9YAU0_9FIRM|nr:hypothetical protein HOLDEFILI_02947 [Holdemania filiformis DSM 12042]